MGLMLVWAIVSFARTTTLDVNSVAIRSALGVCRTSTWRIRDVCAFWDIRWQVNAQLLLVVLLL